MSSYTQDAIESIRQGIDSLVNNSVLPALSLQLYRACGCGGEELPISCNMSDQTQTCPPAWELITTPRRTCARPSIMLANSHVIQLCSLLEVFNTLGSVKGSLDIRLETL